MRDVTRNGSLFLAVGRDRIADARFTGKPWRAATTGGKIYVFPVDPGVASGPVPGGM